MTAAAIGWTPARTYTGRRDAPVIWGPCPTCGQRCQLIQARNGEGRIPTGCRACRGIRPLDGPNRRGDGRWIA